MPTQHLTRAALALAFLWAASAQAASLITGVVQTGGDADRPPAQYTGQTYAFTNGQPAFFDGQSTTVPVFGEDVLAMTDRVHNWNGALTNLAIPLYLAGQEYVQIANNNRDNAAFRLDITVNGPASIFLLLDNRLGDADPATPPTLSATLMPWVASLGFQPVNTGHNRTGDLSRPDELGVDEGGGGDGSGRGTGPGDNINQFASVYQLDVPAGTVSLPEQNGGGLNMYGVVVTPPQVVPEPGALTLLAAAGIILGFAPRRRH